MYAARMSDSTAPAKPRILAVDDDAEIRDMLRRGLSIEGFDVQVAADGEEALAAISSGPVDAVVLDVMLPGLNGLDVLRRIRVDDDVPVLFLSARDRVRDRIAGLDAGGDDYLPKPFAFGELVARLRALLRRQEPSDREGLDFADVHMDLGAYEVRRAETALRLTQTEFELLRAFLEQPNRVLTREALLKMVWGFQPSAVSNVVDVYVSYLRRKLESAGGSRLIHTVRGVGYVLRMEST